MTQRADAYISTSPLPYITVLPLSETNIFSIDTLILTAEKMAGSMNTLNVDNVLAHAASALRRDNEGQLSLKTPFEAIALIGHACMKAVDFRLLGLGEEHTIGLREIYL